MRRNPSTLTTEDGNLTKGFITRSYDLVTSELGVYSTRVGRNSTKKKGGIQSSSLPKGPSNVKEDRKVPQPTTGVGGDRGATLTDET